jgi:hypothetical protein
MPSSTPLALTAEFGEAPGKQTQWKAFLKKSGLNASESLNDIVKELDGFVMPVVEGITSSKTLGDTWRPRGPWKPTTNLSTLSG